MKAEAIPEKGKSGSNLRDEDFGFMSTYHTFVSGIANEVLAISIPSAVSLVLGIKSAVVGAMMQAIVAVQLIGRYLGRRCQRPPA